MWVHLSVHKYLLSTCNVPGTVLGSGDASDSKASSSLAVIIILLLSAPGAVSQMSLCSEPTSGMGIPLAGDEKKEEFCSHLTHLPMTQFLMEESISRTLGTSLLGDRGYGLCHCSFRK